MIGPDAGGGVGDHGAAGALLPGTALWHVRLRAQTVC
jgi:hypothetical protein